MNIKKESTRLVLLAAGAALAATGSASADNIQTLPKGEYVCKPVTEENLKSPPPFAPDSPEGDNAAQTEAIEEFSEEAELDRQPCTEGEVPYPRAQVDSEATKEMPPEAPDLSVPPFGPDASAYYATNYEPYRWIVADFNRRSYGGFVEVNVAKPPDMPNTSYSHSIAELLFKGDRYGKYTVEIGWKATSGPSDGRPRLFTFVNKDDYASFGQPGGDCYNCYFVPSAGADYVPGQELPYTYPPENFVTLQMGAFAWLGDWWIWVGDEWIGYLDGDFWPQSFSESPEHLAYGETYDPTHMADMGNGHFGTNQYASVMRNPQAIVDYGSIGLQGVDERLGQNPELWGSASYGYTGGNISEDRRHWKFGGPGVN